MKKKKVDRQMGVKLRHSGCVEGRVLCKIFGPEREEVIGDCIKLHNDEVHGLHSSPTSIRVIK